MAKKKKVQITKIQLAQYGLILLIVLGLGFMFGQNWVKSHANYNAKNAVVLADSSVKPPAGLVDFLKKQDGCKGQKSIGIWSIYQTSENKFAKIAYGCGVSLESYIMAVKQSSGWILIPVNQYFLPAKDGGSVSGYGPSCDIVAKYFIDNSIEPVCVTKLGQSKVVP